MDKLTNSFDVVLKSNDSMLYYPTNLISHFTNQFVNGITLNGEWLCAIKMIGYHKTWLNITERDGVAIWIRILFNEEETDDGDDDGDNRKIIYMIRKIPEGSYTDDKSIIEMIYAIGESIYDQNTGKVFSLGSILKIYFTPSTRKFSFKILDKSVSLIDFTIYDQKGALQLKDILGIPPDVSTFSISRKRGYTLPLEANFSKNLENLWIYTPNLVYPIQIGEKQNDLLAIIPVDNMRNTQGDYIHYNVENPMYLRVKQTDVRSIEVLITDSILRKVPFDDFSGPVVLTLHFKLATYSIENIHLTHNDEEYLYILSDRCKNMYPNNTASNFTNTLSVPLELYGGAWEVALCSLRYQKSWKQLTTDQTVRIDFQFQDGKYLDQSFDIKFHKGHYYHPNDLVDIWNKKGLRIARIPEIPDSPEASSIFSLDNPTPPKRVKRRPKYLITKLGSLVRMVYMKATRKYFFKVMTSKSGAPFKAQIDFLPRDPTRHPYYHQLLNLFGVVLERDSATDVILPESHTLQLSNLEQPPFLQSSPDLQDNTFNLFVTSPIVDWTVTGETSLQLLNIVPVKGRTNEYIHHTYKDRHYTKVISSTIRDINIQIVDSLKEIIQFETFHIQKQTIAVLHFRRIQKLL